MDKKEGFQELSLIAPSWDGGELVELYLREEDGLVQVKMMEKALLEPVAYLYNGVKLPPLPEWDRERYPYAFIAHTAKIYIYFFVLDEPTYHEGSDGLWCISAVSHSVTDYKDPSEWRPGSGDTINRACYNLMWSNFDMLSRTGSVLLEASEPVPVYE